MSTAADHCQSSGVRTLAGSLGGLTEESIPAEMRDRLIGAFRGLRKR